MNQSMKQDLVYAGLEGFVFMRDTPRPSTTCAIHDHSVHRLKRLNVHPEGCTRILGHSGCRTARLDGGQAPDTLLKTF